MLQKRVKLHMLPLF